MASGSKYKSFEDFFLGIFEKKYFTFSFEWFEEVVDQGIEIKDDILFISRMNIVQDMALLSLRDNYILHKCETCFEGKAKQGPYLNIPTPSIIPIFREIRLLLKKCSQVTSPFLFLRKWFYGNTFTH